MPKMYAALESAIFGVAFLAVGSATHLTWWNAILLAITDAFYVWDEKSLWFQRLWQVSISLSFLVQLTVLFMSVLGCNMIRNALRDVGPWMYYFGNFALHYWPTIRTTVMRPHQKLQFSKMHYDAARIVAVYATIFRPEQVYSCEDISPYLVLPLGIFVSICLEYLILQFTCTFHTDVEQALLFGTKVNR